MKIKLNYNIQPDFNSNKQGMTVAMWLAKNKQEIPQRWFHNPELQNNKEYTVAMIMAQNNINIPEQWRHDPSIQSSFDFATVALLQAKNGHIPEQIWQHNKYLRIKINYIFKSVQCLLQEKKIDVPEYWQYDYIKKDKEENTYAMLQANQGIIPQKQYYHDPEQTNKRGETVAMILILNNILPSIEWMYDIDKQLQQKVTLRQLLELQNLPVPTSWNKNQQLTAFDQAFYRFIPDNTNQSSQQDQYGFTVAMILAINKIQIPKQWFHDPEITNCHGFTVAMCQAYVGQVPDDQWTHDRFYRVFLSKPPHVGTFTTTQIPQHTTTSNPTLTSTPTLTDNTHTTLMAPITTTTPTATNVNPAHFYTVQNILNSYNLQVPFNWSYNNVLDAEDNTQAMLCAINGVIPTETATTSIYHAPQQSNIYQDTVCSLLLEKGVLPPNCWAFKMNFTKRSENFLQKIFQSEKIKIGAKKVEIFKFQTISDTCCICFQDLQQNVFIKSVCDHKVCFQCFKQILQSENFLQCPICRKNQWFQINDEVDRFLSLCGLWG